MKSTYSTLRCSILRLMLITSLFLLLAFSIGNRALAQRTPPVVKAAPAKPAAALPSNLPEPGRFEPYMDYLDENSEAIMNFRIYSPQREKSNFNTIRALREERERTLRARFGGAPAPQAPVPETSYRPVPKPAAPNAKVPAPTSKALVPGAAAKPETKY